MESAMRMSELEGEAEEILRNKGAKGYMGGGKVRGYKKGGCVMKADSSAASLCCLIVCIVSLRFCFWGTIGGLGGVVRICFDISGLGGS